MRNDSQFALDLKYATEHGIPLSIYYGREVSPGEAVWLPEDRDYVTAYVIEQSLYCPECGTRPDEWDVDVGGRPDAYIAESYRCRGCELREIESALWFREDAADRSGIKVKLVENHPKQGHNVGK